MICPTDYLEPAIRSRFKGQKFFYTSLGNSLSLDDNTLGSIVTLIEKNDIHNITFILSEDNSIILDALSDQKYSDISGLREAYCHLNQYKKHTLNSWELNKWYTLVLSYHLNEKIRKLRSQLRHSLQKVPDFDGKLFSKSYNSFRPIYSEIVCIDPINVN